MVQEWVVVLGLGLALGLVLGYCSAMPRVWRLEKELAQAPRMARELRLEKSKVEGLQREWEKEKARAKKIQAYQVLVKKLESELAQERLKASE
jgi:hypothetical protein